MKQLILFFSISILMISCEFIEPSKCPEIQQSEATVMQVQGVYIYIMAYPNVKYQVLGVVRNDLWDQAINATKGKGRDVVAKLLKTSSDNVDFNKLLEHMVELSRQQFPNLQGIVFSQNLSQCSVVVFQ